MSSLSISGAPDGVSEWMPRVRILGIFQKTQEESEPTVGLLADYDRRNSFDRLGDLVGLVLEDNLNSPMKKRGNEWRDGWQFSFW